MDSYLDTLPLRMYPRRRRVSWSVGWLWNNFRTRALRENPDLIHIHWVGQGFVPIKALAELKLPLVWTLHDMWAFTGGCHYSRDCQRYRQSCGACPELSSQRENDLTRWVWKQKKRHWKGIDLTIVTPSKWLSTCSQSSSLFRNRSTEVIPYGLDLNVYKPLERSLAREITNLNKDKKIILMSALAATEDPRKGFPDLVAAAEHLAQAGWGQKAELLVLGSSRPIHPPRIALPVNFAGILHDDVSLSLYYRAADAFVAPSSQDNLPNTVMEAMACGTPCAAFNIGGMTDMIEHQRTGYLARPFDTEDLARGLAWILEDATRAQQLSEAARGKVEAEFTLESVAQRYRDLYSRLLGDRSNMEIR
jgi:glycosyltransferase involved in cell wall biosynthesis